MVLSQFPGEKKDEAGREDGSQDAVVAFSAASAGGPAAPSSNASRK